MRLSEKAIREFKEIYSRQYRETLSNAEAREMAERFMSLMEIICRPIPGVDCPKIKNHPSKIGCFDNASEEIKMEV